MDHVNRVLPIAEKNQKKLQQIGKLLPEYEKGLDSNPIELPFSLYIKLKEILLGK